MKRRKWCLVIFSFLLFICTLNSEELQMKESGQFIRFVVDESNIDFLSLLFPNIDKLGEYKELIEDQTALQSLKERNIKYNVVGVQYSYQNHKEPNENSRDEVLGSNTSNVNIPDNGNAWSNFTMNEPGNPIITGISYDLRVYHTWVSDLLLEINNGHRYLTVWNHLGGTTDGGNDDDSADDDDIDFNWRWSTYFNGEPINDTWSLYAEDTAGGDTGYIDWFKINFFYDPPLPDLIVEDIWTNPSDPDVGEDTDLHCRIKNIGDASSGTYRIRYYMDGSYVDYDTASSLDPDETDSSEEEYSYQFTSSGNHTYYVVVDQCSNESSTGNNSRSETVYAYPVNHPPNTPYNEDPDDGETNVTITHDLDWSCTDPDGDNLDYYVYFGTDSTPDAGEYQGIATGSNYPLPTLNYNIHYYWKIIAFDPDGLQTSSPVWDFWTHTGTPVATIQSPSSPVSVDLNTSQTFIVSATDPGGDLEYVEWYYDNIPQETNDIGFSGSSDTDSWSYNFEQIGTHEIKAIVYDENWLHSDSVIWTVNVLGITQYYWSTTTSSGNPVSNNTLIEAGTTIYLNVHATGYSSVQCYIYEDDIVREDEGREQRDQFYTTKTIYNLSDGFGYASFTLPWIDDVSGGPEFYFRVLDSSSYQSDLVKVQDTTDPSVPVLTLPSNGDAFDYDQNEISFNWQDSGDGAGSGVDDYHILVATNSSFSTIVWQSDRNTSDASHQFVPGDTYYWKVNATDEENNTSDYCDYWSFTINSPLSITLNQPSSNLTINEGAIVNINWTAAGPNGSSVSILRDIDQTWDNGNHTWLVLGQQLNGSYSWNTSGVSAGTYYIGGMVTDGNTYESGYAIGVITINAKPVTNIESVTDWNSLYPTKSLTFTVDYSDADGVDNLQNLYLRLAQNNSEETNRITLMTASGSTSPSQWSAETDYIQSCSASYQDITNGFKVSWTVVLDWNWVESSDVDVWAFCSDDQDLYSDHVYDNCSKTYENDIRIYSSNPDPVDGEIEAGETFTVSGLLRFVGSNTPPDNWSGLSVQMRKNSYDGELIDSQTAITNGYTLTWNTDNNDSSSNPYNIFIVPVSSNSNNQPANSDIYYDVEEITVLNEMLTLNQLFGDPVLGDDITLFGENYTLLQFHDPNNDGKFFWLPFEAGVTIAAEPNLLVTDGNIAELLFTIQAINTYFEFGNLFALESNLQQINDDANPEQWWIRSISPFSKRKVDRIKIGNGCFAAANSLTKSYVTGAGTIKPNAYIGATLSFINEVNQLGIFEEDENAEIMKDIKAVLNMQILYGADSDALDDFFDQWPEQLVANSISFINDYESINDMLGTTESLINLQFMLDDPSSIIDSEFWTEYDSVIDDLSGMAIGMLYDMNAELISGNLGLDQIKQCAKMLAWSLDIHNDAIFKVTTDLIEIIQSINDIQNMQYSSENSDRILSLYQSLLKKYTFGYKALSVEYWRVYSKYTKRIKESDNSLGKVTSNWIGCKQTNLDNAIQMFEYENIDYVNLITLNNQYLTKASLSRIVYDWALEYYNSMLSIDRLQVSLEESSIQAGVNNPINIVLKNTYPVDIDISNVSIDPTSLGLDPRSFDLRTTVFSGEEMIENKTITLPSDWLTYHLDEIDENNNYPVGIAVTWIVSGEEYQHTFFVDVKVVSEHRIVEISPDQKVYRAGESNILEFEYSSTLPVDGVSIVNYLLKPDGTPQTWGFDLNATNRVFSIEEILPDGPYGAWNTKSFLIQSSEAVTPILYSNGVFYLVPEINGNLTSFDWHNFKVLYPTDDEEAAFEIRDILQLNQEQFIDISSYSNSALLNIASNQDVILLGGGMVNPLTAQITDFDLVNPGDAQIEVVTNAFNNHNAIVIAGWDLRDTQTAVVGFIDSWNTEVKNVLPEVEIQNPNDDFETYEEEITIDGIANVLWGDIISVELNVNNGGWEPADIQDLRMIGWSLTVSLEPGNNLILVKSIDSDGDESEIAELSGLYSFNLDIPQNVIIEVQNSQVIISWDNIVNANSYKIFASSNPVETPFESDVTDDGWFEENGNRINWVADEFDYSEMFFQVKSSTDEPTVRNDLRNQESSNREAIKIKE